MYSSSKVLRRFELTLHKCLVDDHLGGDVDEFGFLLRFHLLAHGLEVARLRVLRQDRRERARTMFPNPRMRGVCLVATLFLANWKFAACYVLDRLWRSAEERVGSEGFEILSFVGRVLYPADSPTSHYESVERIVGYIRIADQPFLIDETSRRSCLM
jgi:hypothetical protein